MTEKLNVLILISHYLPGTKLGGPLTSIVNLTCSLANNFNFFIITSDRDMNEAKPYPNINVGTWLPNNKSLVMYIRRDITCFFHIIKQIKALNPDIIYVNSFLDPFFSIFIVLAQRFNFISQTKIIVAPRGELLEQALEFKQTKKKLFIKLAKILNLYRSVTWHATTEIEKKFISKNMNISLQKIKVARNISNTDTPTIIKNINLNENDYLKIIFLARISKDKNIQFTFDVLKEITDINIQYDIYGPIEDIDIWELCQKKLTLLPSNINVNYKGLVRKENVKQILAKYDLFFMPSFSENYGHSIAEALSVGTPVLISDKTPWRDLSTKGLGWDLNLKDKKKFIETIQDLYSISPRLREGQREQRIKTSLLILNDPIIYQENFNLLAL